MASSKESADGWGDNRLTEWNPEEQKKGPRGSQSGDLADDKIIYIGGLCKEVTES